MSSEDVVGEKAVSRFRKGYNCAQSVPLTMFEHWNGGNVLVPKIATAFGGGIGRCGSVCGALTGGVMAIGIKYGTNEPSAEKRLRAYELARKAYRRFEKRHGSVLCQELIGYDLSDPGALGKPEMQRFSKRSAPASLGLPLRFLCRSMRTRSS